MQQLEQAEIRDMNWQQQQMQQQQQFQQMQAMMQNLQASMFEDPSRPGPPQVAAYNAQAAAAAAPWLPTQPQQGVTAPLGAAWQQPYGQAAPAAAVSPVGPTDTGRAPGLLRRHLPEVPTEQLHRLIGPAPTPNPWQTSMPSGTSMADGKEPIPKWDGTQPAARLRPWLRELRLWRMNTSIPLHRHGYLLSQSFPEHSWMRQCAHRLPEEVMLTDRCWDLIMTEILTQMKPFLDIETKVLIEQLFFTTTRENKETMSSYLTRKTNKHRELSVGLGHKCVKCQNCLSDVKVKEEIPDSCLLYTSPSPRD